MSPPPPCAVLSVPFFYLSNFSSNAFTFKIKLSVSTLTLLTSKILAASFYLSKKFRSNSLNIMINVINIIRVF